MSDIRKKNRAARAQIENQLGLTSRQGKIRANADVLEGTSKIVIYPSTILPSDFDYSLEREPLVTEHDIDKKDNRELKRTLDSIVMQEPYAAGMIQLYQQSSLPAMFNTTFSEGLSISSVGINKRSLKSKPSEKSKNITNAAHKILAEIMAVKNKDKELLEQKTKDLKDQKFITNSDIYGRYAKIIGKIEKASTEKKRFYHQGDISSKNDTLKEEYFYNKRATVKHRTSIKEGNNPYTYVTKGKSSTGSTPRRKSSKPGLKTIRILKFESIDENTNENIQVGNETVFLEMKNV